jgi:stearoyl-CoA desaturase (delta-9 desaturase)
MTNAIASGPTRVDSAPTPKPAGAGTAKPMLNGLRPACESALVYAFTLVPTLALAAAVPLAWGWGPGWVDVGLAVGFYLLSGLGVTVGFYRYLTHRAFKANRPLRNALAVAGSLAGQGDVITWTADHRRHHAFADKEGDPHSPWLFGTGPVALAKGFWHGCPTLGAPHGTC